MTLSEATISLQRAAHDLMYLGMDGSPVYSDDLSRRNGEVYRLIRAFKVVLTVFVDIPVASAIARCVIIN